MTACSPRLEREGGFALLVLFGLIASASVGLVFAVQAFLPPLADVTARTDRSLATVEVGARDQFRQNGAFPATLAALATATNGTTSGRWQVDPWSAGLDLDYGVVGTDLRVRSRGTDGSLGTGDDLTSTVPVENMVRARQRARLRLIRAVLARSGYRNQASMSPADEASMLAALRDYATAKRQWLTADAASRVTLQTQMDSAAATVAALVSTHSCPPLPAFVTGSGGLMENLGLLDAKATDGLGAVFVGDTTVAVIARGADATGGTDDDM